MTSRVIQLTYSAIGILSYVYTFWTLFLAAVFLYRGRDEKESTRGNVSSWWIDVGLVVLFAVQHSLMSSDFAKKVFNHFQLDVVQRAIYVGLSAVTLQTVMGAWQPINGWWLWRLSADSLLHYLIVLLHVISWVLVCCTCLAVDYLELLGVKQIYYHLKNLGSPMDVKSHTVQRIYAHSRHPILFALVLLLWATPWMTGDRLFLAIALPLYQVSCSRLDEADIDYVQEQLARKRFELVSRS